jgi:hypothetical protein
MKKSLALLATLVMSACAAYETNGMGMINGQTVDISLTEKTNGMSLSGYDLAIDGEQVGTLSLDGVEVANANRQVYEFNTLQTQYGVFDLSQTIVNNFVDPTFTFRLTLDGDLVATIQRSVM